MRVLVTGAGGYVGGGLVQSLTAAGWEVHALVREEAPFLDVRQTVAELGHDRAAAAPAFQGVDAVVHLAGENEIEAARSPAASLASTVLATENVVENAAAAGVARLVYMSTVHVYGGRMVEGATLTEDLRPEPAATYAISRLASEHLASSLRSRDGVVVLRLTNSVGPPANAEVDRWTLVTNDLCRQGALTGRLELRSSGVQWRDFVALRDVHAAIGAACQENVLPPGTYNLGSGRPLTVRALAELVQDAFEDLTGDRPELHAPDPDPVTPRPYTVSVERAAGHGVRARTPISEAVEQTARFCIENREGLR